MELRIFQCVIYAYLLTIPLLSCAQDLTCREWYYIEDRNGNKIKDKCMVAWQENSIGQKNGKYVYYKENGATLEVAYFKNDVLNGKYVLYSRNNTSILDSGRHVNGKKSGKWLHDGNNYVSYVNDKPSGSGIRKYTELQLTGNYTSTGAYNGTILIHEKTTSVSPMTERKRIYAPLDSEEWLRDAMDTRVPGKYEYTLPFPKETCSSCVEAFHEEIVKRVYDNFSNTSFVFLTGDVSNGLLKNESMQIWVDGKVIPDSKEILKGVIAEIENKELEAANKAQLEKERKRRDESGESMLSVSKFGLAPISFQLDSYDPDSNGNAIIENLRSYLSNVDASTIQYLIIIGHAAADDELSRVVFNPLNQGSLQNKAGNWTNLSESDLANLRMILSLGRAKSLYRSIEKLPATKELLDSKKIFLLPAGTEFGKELVQNSVNQNTVQVVILTNDGNEINTHSNAIPFGTSFKESTVLKKVNELIRNIGLNFSKFVPALMSASDYGAPLPDYKGLASGDILTFTNKFR